MSGCGRKHRAKHLVRQYLDDDAWEGPQRADEQLAVCIAAPSAKHVHVVLVDPPRKKEDGEATPTPAEGVEEVEETLPPRSVADLPGKFSKVLWLGCGDLVVLRMGSIQYKPSPPQLKSFYASPEGKEWEPLIKRAETAALSYFKKVQSQTVTKDTAQTLSGAGKFAVRAVEGGAAPVTAAAPSSSSAIAGAEAPLPAPTSAKHAKVAEVDPLAGMMGDSDDDLNDFVNPNRQSIKHRRQAFFPDEDEEEEHEEGDEEEEEDE